ncbi:MAG: rhodanese-like domain-containing protein [Gammaproteobacteria bacterium]|jgi:rhodanese-related sulfurtransferase|nr:rhodanese-like domain-containing protein [Gammaproteobacteria bacterium]
MKFTLNLIFCSVLLLVSTFVAAEKKDVPDTLDGTTKVTAEEVIELVESMDDLVVVDARKSSDREKGWIEGSVGLPNTETNADSLAKLLPAKSTPVLFYCNGVKCGRSFESAKIAIAEGYSKIYWFRGGMEEWEAKGLPVVK